MKQDTVHLGILGAGNMGLAIARGLLGADPNRRLELHSRSGLKKDADFEHIRTHSSPSELEQHADVLLICVKPGQLTDALQGLTGKKRYVTIAAGVSIATLRTSLGQEASVARVMPNLLARIGMCVSGVYCEDPQLKSVTLDIFNTLGLAIAVETEDLLHAVTGLSGSGPAFVFEFLHALAEGGVLSGLSYKDALELAAHTLQGSAALVLQSGRHPSELRNQVTSPGGTTIAGLRTLEAGALHGTVMEAVLAATERSRQLGEKALDRKDSP